MIFDTREELYQHASQWLAKQPAWAPVINVIGPCRHEAKPEREPYEAIIRAVAYQQLTAKAGESILGRLCETFQTGASGFPQPQQLVTADSEALRAC